MNSVYQHMQKKFNQTTWIAILLLVISLIINAVLSMNLLDQNKPKSIIGTYCTGTGQNKNDKYIVFQQDGSYTSYMQFQLIEEGNYEITDNNSYLLQPSENSEGKHVIYNEQNFVYYIDSQSNITIYDKISSTPTFINIKKDK